MARSKEQLAEIARRRRKAKRLGLTMTQVRNMEWREKNKGYFKKYHAAHKKPRGKGLLKTRKYYSARKSRNLNLLFKGNEFNHVATAPQAAPEFTTLPIGQENKLCR
jgi:hypothetical protein